MTCRTGVQPADALTPFLFACGAWYLGAGLIRGFLNVVGQFFPDLSASLQRKGLKISCSKCEICSTLELTPLSLVGCQSSLIEAIWAPFYTGATEGVVGSLSRLGRLSSALALMDRQHPVHSSS